jgi:hypothetical protein
LFDETVARRQLRQTRSLVAPAFLDPETASALRNRAFLPFWIADRGRYHQAEEVDAPLFDRLRAWAESLAETPLEAADHQWLRLRHGDYQLTRDDSVRRISGRHYELVLDFSERATGQAEIVYGERLRLPQLPLSLALVERDDSQYRYQRYLNHQVGEAEVFRLRLSLRFAR